MVVFPILSHGGVERDGNWGEIEGAFEDKILKVKYRQNKVSPKQIKHIKP